MIVCYNKRGHFENLPKVGRPIKTTVCMDSHIKKTSQNNTQLSAPKIIVEIPKIMVSPQTIQGGFSRHPAKRPLISARNQVSSLELTCQLLNWTADD